MLRRIYIEYINKDFFTGSDKFMINLNRNCYCVGRFELSEYIDNDEMWKKTKKRIKNYIDKNDDIFLYFDLIQKKYKINKNLKLNDLCIETDKSFNDYIEDEKFHKNMGLFYIYNKKENLLEFVINHIVYDFIKARKFLRLVYFEPCKDVLYKAHDYSYKPLFNDVIHIFCYLRYFKFFFIDKFYKFRNFSDTRNRVVRKFFSNNIYSNYKKYKKVEISLALTCLHIFKSLKVNIKTFNITYLLGFNNDRFRNNYTSVLLQIKVSLDFFKVIENISNELKKNFIFSLGIYDMLNYSLTPKIQTNIKKKIHMQFSNIYNSNKELGIYFKCGYFIVNKTQTPFYVTSSFNNGLNCICIQYNTIDINEKKLNEEIEHYI